MFIYTVAEALVGIVAGLLIAILSRKKEGVVPTKLDRLGVITNILLLVGYVFFSPVYMFIGMICEAAYSGILGVIGWAVSFICASAALFCCVGLGLSVALRKRGKSTLSFALQFLGAAAIALSLLLFAIFYGNLLTPLN